MITLLCYLEYMNRWWHNSVKLSLCALPEGHFKETCSFYGGFEVEMSLWVKWYLMITLLCYLEYMNSWCDNSVKLSLCALPEGQFNETGRFYGRFKVEMSLWEKWYLMITLLCYLEYMNRWWHNSVKPSFVCTIWRSIQWNREFL